MNFFFIILLWQHILYLCTLFLVQGGKWFNKICRDRQLKPKYISFKINGRKQQKNVLPDDDKRYAIETCRSSESVLKKWFKNKWHTISAFVGCVIINETKDCLIQSALWNPVALKIGGVIVV